MQKGKLFKLVQGEVKYPTWCPQGLYLVNGDEVIPVERFLADKICNRIGEELELDYDFEVHPRTLNPNWGGKSALLCDKGEIAGGSQGKKEWEITILKEDEKGNQKKYLASEIKVVLHASRLESPLKIKERNWRILQQEFKQKYSELNNNGEIINWVRSKAKELNLLS